MLMPIRVKIKFPEYVGCTEVEIRRREEMYGLSTNVRIYFTYVVHTNR
jgi:hypothetical protein